MNMTQEIQMKYKIDDMITINNKQWRIAEYRMHSGRKWMYTLSHENTDGTFKVMNLNERAIEAIEM